MILYDFLVCHVTHVISLWALISFGTRISRKSLQKELKAFAS